MQNPSLLISNPWERWWWRLQSHLSAEREEFISQTWKKMSSIAIGTVDDMFSNDPAASRRKFVWIIG